MKNGLQKGGRVVISYAPLWETMKKRGVTTYALINMIDRVDVFPDDSHGCILKAVRFKIPLRDMDTGKPFDTFEITGVTDENGRQVFLPIEGQDETVVLLVKANL
jgi:hypothetical protein